MSGPELLASCAGVLRTRMGAFWPGQRAVFRGRDLHQELRNSDWLALYMFGITGRQFTPQQLKLLHGIWVITSYPDTRLWNNRVAGLAGTARSSPTLGLSAALAVSEATIYGGGAGIRAFDFITRAAKATEAGLVLRDFVSEEVNSRYLYGYGRPIHRNDERLQWLASLAEEQGLASGKHFKLAFEVGKTLVEIGKPNLRMNYAGMVAPLGADLGLSRREFQLFRVPLFFAGMPPCWLEAADKPEGTLFPTPCDKIVYEGVKQRAWRA
ncbi:MAG: citryl-CoA lyase [Rhodocyclales bacterium RIFCSPLOWO2_02_FULL_63_24]|nr:MAG: citryl-CoA lyase [Rhodocyclales bacterium RIFCSPLOWO2_02_FULL_63_24]